MMQERPKRIREKKKTDAQLKRGDYNELERSVRLELGQCGCGFVPQTHSEKLATILIIQT